MLQLTGGFAMIVTGAHFFAGWVEHFSMEMGVNPLILSLILAPIATELPEAANSLLWVSDRKDNIALGNINGAVVFQSTLPITLGVLLTPWALGELGKISAIFALVSASIIYIMLLMRGRDGRLPVTSLLMGGILYVIFAFLVALR